jgi:hypothetical protein
MLTIVNPITIDGYTVYHDDENEIQALNNRIDGILAHDPIAHPDAGPAPKPDEPIRARRFYVLPKQPTLATDSDGKPYFSLIVYRFDQSKLNPDSKNDVGGGILTFTVELAVPDDDMAKIRSRLRSLVFGDSSGGGAEDVEVNPVEFTEGKVLLAIAGEDGSGGGTFVKNLVGSGKVSGIGDNRKAVMVNLTQGGAALLESLDKIRVLPINVGYELQFEYRLLGVRMRVWCDVNSSYHLLQSVFHDNHEEDSGYLGMSHDNVRTDKVTAVTELFIKNHTAGVEVLPETSQIPQDQLDQMQRAGQDILSKQIDKMQDAHPPSPDMDRSYLTQYFSDMSTQFNQVVDRRMVLTRFYNPSVNLRNVFRRSDIESMVQFVDLTKPEFAVLQVPIRINADFSRLPISSVTVTVTYRSRTRDGSTNTATKSFDFTDGSTVQTFVCYANTLGDIEYDWKAVVHYKTGVEPFTLSKSGETAKYLVVDVGSLGLIAVEIGLGLVDLDKFSGATVDVRYQSAALGHPVEQTFKLDKETPKVLWTDIIREATAGAYQYRVDWQRKSDGGILEGTWQDSDSLRLRVDVPVVDRMNISVLSTGNFKDPPEPIASIAVSLRYTDPKSGHPQEGSLVFTDEKQVLPWSVELRDDSFREYQYRYIIVYKGGRTVAFPKEPNSWLPGTPGFLVVGENYGLQVNIYPYLLGFGDREKLVEVDMMYTDPEKQTTLMNSFVFSRENNKPVVWRVRTSDGLPQAYGYNVKYISSTGDQIKLPTQSSSSDSIILLPAPAR